MRLRGELSLTKLYEFTDNRKRGKPIVWLGNTLVSVQHFPSDIRDLVGKQLRLVQCGELPTDWKPMSTIGPGTVELRVHLSGEYRVIYVSKFPEAIYILNAFLKKTEKTPRLEIIRARRAYAEIKHKQDQD